MATRSKTVPMPVNQNAEHYQNYTDRTVSQPLDPKATRQENAFNRYLLCGIFSEVQLVGFSEQGAPVYRVFTSPNLESQANITFTRKGKSVAVVVEDLSLHSPATNPESYTESQRKVWKDCQHARFALAGAAGKSDADLLPLAWRHYVEATLEIARHYTRTK